ncbi:MAG: P1 family peptidase [Hyphomicrobiaceae bacterium]
MGKRAKKTPVHRLHANLITDVAGLSVGNADDADLRSGASVVVFDQPAIAACSVLGGAPAGVATQSFEPDMVIEAVDALVLSGGSGFGLEATTGVQAWLRQQGRGFQIGETRIPIVAGAICFDMLNGGDKSWGRYAPYRELGFAAAERTSAGPFALGTAGGGFGASTVNLKGGLGSASAVTPSGHTVGALVVVNAIGAATMGEGPHFWAAGYEVGKEFGGLGFPKRISTDMTELAWKGGPTFATTIAIVATDAILTKPMAKRLAITANDGFARALRITHALFDGDTVFAASTGRRPLKDPVNEQIEIGAVAADCVARAIARGVYEATPYPFGTSPLPTWRERFG